MRRTRTLSSAAAAAVALAVAGCSVIPTPPEAAPTEWVPSPTPSAFAEGTLANPYGFTRFEQAAYRIRNHGCKAFSTGSGFAIDAHTIITNAHVINKPYEIEVTSHDGHDITVESSSFTKIADIGIIKTEQALEVFAPLAALDIEVGKAITVAGYPLGDQLTLSTGVILEQTDDVLGGNAEFVFQTSAKSEPGSSGSAVYNTDGEVIGVIYAGDDDDTGTSAYLIPVSILHEILADESTLKNNKRACS